MERHAAILTEALASRGHRVSVVTTALPAGHSDQTATGSEPTLYLAGTTWRRYSRSWWQASATAVHRLSAADRPDVIWSQSIAGLGYARSPVRDRGIPVVSVMHGTALGELRGNLRAWRHAPSARGVAVVGLALKRRLCEPLVWGPTATRVCRWIAVSDQVAEDLAYLGVERERVSVVPNGIDTARFRPDLEARAEIRAELGIDPAGPVAVVAGRLTRQKGVDVAIRAVARVPGLHLVVAGDGGARAELERRVQLLGLAGRVRFGGPVAYQRVPSLLAAADIGLMPSLLEEAFPLSLIEAMATGLPVVASRVGGVPTAVRPGVDGALVPPGDVDALARVLGELADNPSRRAELGANARKRALACFDTKRMVDATEAVFEREVR